MKSDSKLTPWFPPEINPVHIGVYQKGDFPKPSYSFWNGKYWCVLCGDAEDAEYYKRQKSMFQGEKWRGLKK